MQFEVSTGGGTSVHDVTSEVEERVRESSGGEGLAHVSLRHTTASLLLQENESGLVEDLKELVEELVPEGEGYRHDRIDDNAHSHLRAALLGGSVTFPVRDGEPVLGTWQSVLLLELDGPRTRRVDVEVVG